MRSLAPWLRDAPVILMYHRVAEPMLDPWGMCVAPDRFREQLGALKAAGRSFLSMSALVDGLVARSLPPAATAVTFDDGYADNAEIAKPILEELAIPATIFVASRLVGGERPFWWDELAAMVLLGREACAFQGEIAGEHLALELPAQSAVPADLGHWRAYRPSSDDPRRRAYVEIWKILERLAPAQREVAMSLLRDVFGDTCATRLDELDLPMSEKVVRKLPSAFVAVGSHGRRHLPLAGLGADDLQVEVAGGKADLAGFGIGADPGFAYPHGSIDARAKNAVIAAGFSWAVSSRSAKVDVRSPDLFDLPRLNVGNWKGERLLREISILPRS